jgi:hypothetical protein
MIGLTQPEFRQLAPALTLATSLLITAIGLVVISNDMASAAQSRQQSAMAQLRQAQKALAQANADAEEIADRLTDLQSLSSLRETGQIDLIHWQEHLESAGQKMGIQRTVMQFSPPEPAPGEAGAPRFQQRRLELQLGLLHEGEFLQMIDFIQTYPRALAVPRQCRLARVHNGPTDTFITLQANCTVDWFSYREMPAGGRP